MASGEEEITKKKSNNLRAQGATAVDPDTTCVDAFRANPTKDHCLSTKDFYGRPCQYCTSKHYKHHGRTAVSDDDDDHSADCLNADQARWAKIFGEKCETISLL